LFLAGFPGPDLTHSYQPWYLIYYLLLTQLP
jgi:hypothetical protein